MSAVLEADVQVQVPERRRRLEPIADLPFGPAEPLTGFPIHRRSRRAILAAPEDPEPGAEGVARMGRRRDEGNQREPSRVARRHVEPESGPGTCRDQLRNRPALGPDEMAPVPSVLTASANAAENVPRTLCGSVGPEHPRFRHPVTRSAGPP
jgi:hypothetical protein